MACVRLSRLVTLGVVLTLALALVPALPRAGAQGGTLAYGDVVQGQITAKNYYEVWEFSGKKGDRVEILMEGDGNLDPYLGLIESASETVLVEDDDSGGDSNAYIDFTLPSAGSFMIIATRYDLDTGTSQGAYTLSLAGGSGPTTVANPLTTSEPVEIEPGIFYMGDIVLEEPVSGTIENAAYAQLYSLELEAGTELLIAMVAEGGSLDSYLYFADEAFNLLAEDDDSAAELGGGTLDAFLGLTVPKTGMYYVIATRAGADTGTSTGPYTLVAGLAEPEPEPVVDNGLPQGVDFMSNVRMGDSVQGELTAASYMHLYAFEGQAGDEVTITMTGSGGLDAYLGLLDPASEIVAEDDDSLGGLDALITVRLPESGTYLVAATRSGVDTGTTTGGYTLELYAGAPQAEPGASGLSSFGGLPGRAIAAGGETFYLRGNGASDNPAKSPPVEAFMGLDAGDLPGRSGGANPLLPLLYPSALELIGMLSGGQ